MANNNLEKYLEAILDKIADGTETDIPRPSWNIEKYLAAIYEALSEGGGGGGSGGGVLVVHQVPNGAGVRLDKTYKEIADAGFCVREVLVNDGLHVITPIGSFSFEEEAGGYVKFGADEYICSAENEYPYLSK